MNLDIILILFQLIHNDKANAVNNLAVLDIDLPCEWEIAKDNRLKW